MNWNYDLHELPTHRSEPVLIAAKNSNRMFMCWYNRNTDSWVGWQPAFEMLCFAYVDHPRPGKTPPVADQLPKVEKTTTALPPGIILPPVAALPPGVG